MDFDAGAAPPVADLPPVAPVEAPQAPAAAPDVEAPKTAAAPAPKDEFDSGAEDLKRAAAARDPKDGMEPDKSHIRNSTMCKLYEQFKNGQYGTPILYQDEKWAPVPRGSTHVGITESEGLDAGFNRNFANYTASANANVDAQEYDNNPAHAYEFSKDGTLQRAKDLGDKMEQWTSRYEGAKNDAQKQLAARGMATTYGQYLHMLQDNQAHGGTDAAEHYGDHVDEKPDSIKAARADTKAAFTDLRTYLDSRKVNSMALNPGPTPPYSLPPFSALKEACESPDWDGKSRMWPREEMSKGIQANFNSRLRYGPNAVGL